jgi:uncharacterized Zn finger protein (UPF0148 family)
MALKISCPQCKTTFATSEASSGTRVFCPSCNACLLLNFSTNQEKHSFEKNAAHAEKNAQKSEMSLESIHEQAIAHLGNWLDIPTHEIKNTLKKLAENTAYSVWTIPKGTGNGVREILLAIF